MANMHPLQKNDYCRCPNQDKFDERLSPSRSKAGSPSVLTAALFLLCSVAIYAVCLAIDLNTALKGVYVLLACTMVLLLLHTEDMQLSRLSEFEIQPTQATRLVLTLTVLSLIIGTATDVLLVPVTVTSRWGTD